MANEKRLIDTNALKEKAIPDYESGEMLLYCSMVDEAPTVDAVEVVRCKDCKYCDQENWHCDHPMGTTLPVPRKTDDFCSYGERKDNERNAD